MVGLVLDHLDSGSMSEHLEEKDPSQGDDFWVTPSPEPSPVMTHALQVEPQEIGYLPPILEREGGLLPPLVLMPFCLGGVGIGGVLCHGHPVSIVLLGFHPAWPIPL